MAKRTKHAPPPVGGQEEYIEDDSVMGGIGFWVMAVVGFIAIVVAAVTFGTAKIEADIESRAAGALAANGYGDVVADANGTHLSLSGTYRADQTAGAAFIVVERVAGVTSVTGQLWATTDIALEDIVVIGDAIEFNWVPSGVVVSGDISSADRKVFISQTLLESFGSVDMEPLSVVVDIADESDWIGTVLSLVLAFHEPIEVGRIIVIPDQKLLIVAGDVESKKVRNALNSQVVDAGETIGFDVNPAVRVPEVEIEPVEVAPTEKEVVALQIDLDALLKDKVVEFEVKSDVITEIGGALLDEILGILRLEPEIKIEIAGHADAQGSPSANMRLSQARAESVLVYLVAHGESADRYTAVGYGETQPIGDNATQEGRARNRRIEFRASLGEEP